MNFTLDITPTRPTSAERVLTLSLWVVIGTFAGALQEAIRLALTSALILSVLQSLPVCYADRDDPRKPEQLETVAQAITVAANASKRPVDKAAKLVTLFRWESVGCLAVHSGAHKGPGRGLFQLEGQSRRYQGPFVGLDYAATLNAARVAGDVLDHSFQCGGGPAGVFTAYAGRACSTKWKTLTERVNTYWWATWRLSR